MSTAKETVMSTPELLELVLAQLPMRDLLVTAPLVSKAWQEIILSPALQRALFFQPDPSSRCDLEPVQNPLLAEMFPPFFAADEPYERGSKFAIMSMPWSKAPDAFRRRDASWRRMLVTQPPPQTMVVRQTRYNPDSSSRRVVLNDLSLCMGTFYDLTLALIDSDEYASFFCVRWHDDLERDSEGDLTLALQSVPRGPTKTPLDPQFHSDGSETGVEIHFGEWVDLGYMSRRARVNCARLNILVSMHESS